MHSEIIQWLHAHEQWLAWLSLGSAVLFVASLALIPLILIRLPMDYFTRTRSQKARQHPLWFATRILLQNLLGICLLASGILMLVLPGQGLLTMLIGICLIHFPRKQQLIQRMIRMPRIHRSINWIRYRWGIPPVEIPQPPTSETARRDV